MLCFVTIDAMFSILNIKKDKTFIRLSKPFTN